MTQEEIGRRGEIKFEVLMTNLCGRQRPLFRPNFLGDRFPTFDYLVELVDYPHHFFFAQVKSTIRGYTRKEKRLKVELSQQDVDRMVIHPAPTYLVGIDIVAPIETGFLLSINEARGHISSLPTTFPADAGSLTTLADEVHDFWAQRDMVLKQSRFRE